MQRFVYNRFTTSCAANRRRLGNVATELYRSANSGGVGGHWALLVNAAFSSVAGRVCAKTEIRLISACQRPREEGEQEKLIEERRVVSAHLYHFSASYADSRHFTRIIFSSANEEGTIVTSCWRNDLVTKAIDRCNSDIYIIFMVSVPYSCPKCFSHCKLTSTTTVNKPTYRYFVRPHRMYHIHCESKKQDAELVPITSLNINRFQTFFTGGLGSKFATKLCVDIPSGLKHVATLPCEISM